MVKMLGIDYGDARTGLAYSDDLGLLAIGAGCVKSYNPEKAADEIVAKAKEMGIGLMVLGKPLNMNGTEGTGVQGFCRNAYGSHRHSRRHDRRKKNNGSGARNTLRNRRFRKKAQGKNRFSCSGNNSSDLYG